MGIDVVAEGVETADQEAWLAEHNCPLGQGYYYGVALRPALHRGTMRASNSHTDHDLASVAKIPTADAYARRRQRNGPPRCWPRTRGSGPA